MGGGGKEVVCEAATLSKRLLGIQSLKPIYPKLMKPKHIAIGSAIVAVAGLTAYITCLKWFWRPNLTPFVELVSDRFSEVADELNELAVIVNYDEAGNMWLTGKFITDHTEFKDIASVKSALSELKRKGRATVAQVYTSNCVGSDALFAPAPARNSELEEKLWEALIATGFTRKPSQP